MIKKSLACTACGACIQKCPKKCINLEIDEFGFAYPSVNETECIGCNLCNKVCHLEQKIKSIDSNQKAYAAVHNRKEIVNKSTSGGAFTAIAEKVLGDAGVVYGCAYVGHLQACHIRVTDIEHLKLLNGSKYVQSNIGDSYRMALDDLNRGYQVLFSGTPCQIAGLKSFLSREFDNLITVDIICHGVPSQAYFDKFVDWYEKKYNILLDNFDFRSKNNSGWSLAGISTGISKIKNKKIYRKFYYYNNYYYNNFLDSSIYRDSCYSCKYANLNRPGDFTLGDLWGAEGLSLPFDVENGCSLIIANTERANQILKSLLLKTEEIPMNVAIAHNAQLNKPSECPPQRETRLLEFRNTSSCDIQKKFLKENRLKIFKAKIKYSIPKIIKKKLLKIKYKKYTKHFDTK